MGKGNESEAKALLARARAAHQAQGGILGAAMGSNSVNVFRNATPSQATYTKAHTVTSS